MKRILCSFLLLTLFSTTLFANPPLVQKRALSDLESIRNLFEVQYAPTQWKKEYANWCLHQSIENAKNKILNARNPSLKDCQIILRDFCNTARDYHVGLVFFSTENASLPFMVKGAQGRYFICHIDRELSAHSFFFSEGESAFPFEVGDEVITFDGQPIDQAIQAIKSSEVGFNTPETDQAMAEMILTTRRGDLGHIVPTGEVVITIRSKKSGQEEEIKMSWSYMPEKIRDFAQLGDAFSPHVHGAAWPTNVPLTKESGFFQKYLIAHFWDFSYVGNSLITNNHAIGSRSSFIPELGTKIWANDKKWFFDAYIFVTPSNKRIGYIRIPDYGGGEAEVEEFGQIMNLFQQQTDALVIDQISNPGGSIFYLYALASTFIKQPISPPKHCIALTQEEVYGSLSLQSKLAQVKDDASARKALGKTIEGYPVNYLFVKNTREFNHFIIDQWNRGKIQTDSTFLFGFREIYPHPQYRYAKPILFLVNSLDFSGGDFLPALLQDSKRAVIMGSRTAGAGGYVTSVYFPNHLGIRSIKLTGSVAERHNRDKIENLGVQPDIFYELSVVDLQENYKEYVEAIVKAVEELAGGKS